MKRFLSILLASVALCAACAVGASAAAKAAKKTFDPDAIQQCMLINDTRGVTGYGHNGLVMVDKNGYGRFYSYRLGGLLKFTLLPAQLQQFLKDGLPYANSKFQFDKVLAFEVPPEDGRKMYDYIETTEFKEFYRYASFFSSFWPINNDNCTTVAYSTLKAGGQKYAFLYPFGLPNTVFYTLQLNLKVYSVPYTIYHPDGPKPELPEADPNQ